MKKQLPTNEVLERIKKELDTATKKLGMVEVTSEDYKLYLERIEELRKIKVAIESETKLNIDYNNLIPVFGSLAGILLIMTFERTGVLTSKALNFVMKGRV